MNNFRSIGITLLAMSMSVGGYAVAQDRGAHDRNDHQSERGGPPAGNTHQQRPSPHGNSGHHGDPAVQNGSQGNHGYNQRGESRDQRGEWRGAGPGHDLRRGGHLTAQYRSRQFVVDDWRGHHLSAPPRGYHWVRTGSDYVLAAIATGAILQILLNN